MSYFRLLDAARQFLDSNGDPLSGGKLYTYEAGSTTNKSTFQDDNGDSAHTNPIILDAAGRIPAEVFGTTGAYKLRLDDADDTTIWTRDDITGINDTAEVSASEWVASGLTPTYVSGTSFTFAGDQTTVFHSGRRVRIVDAGGTKYATITTSTYSDPNTTIVLFNDGSAIDSGISTVSYGLLSKSNPSLASSILPGIIATTSGRSVTWLNIPSWVTQIEISLMGVSINGATDYLGVRIGTGGTDTTTGYLGSASNAAGSATQVASTLWPLTGGAAGAANLFHGTVHLVLADASTNTWCVTGDVGTSNTAGNAHLGGSVPLAGALDTVTLRISGSTDSFDAGKAGLRYS